MKTLTMLILAAALCASGCLGSVNKPVCLFACGNDGERR